MVQAVPAIGSSYSPYSPSSDSSPYQAVTDSSGWKLNPNYLLTIYDNSGKVQDSQRMVKGYMPETFHFRVQNQWEPFLASLENVGGVLDTVNQFANLAGVSINSKLLSTLVWHRMEPLELSVSLQFDSGNGLNGSTTTASALQDVTTPVMNLLAMATPKRGTGTFGGITLTAPGPTLNEPNSNISMKFGRFFYIDSVVFDSVDVTWHTMAETSGDLIAADVELGIRGWYCPDQNDIFSYFGLGDTGVASYLKSNPQNFANVANGGQAPLIYNTSADIASAFSAVKSFGASAAGIGNNPSVGTVPGGP